MSWFKLDDGFHGHPKVEHAGNAAAGLWVRCASWSARYLTDGHIPDDIARLYGRPAEITRLVDTGLWVRNGTGYIIPDYLDYNPSGDEVRQQRAKRADAGRRGGIRSAEVRRQDHE